MLAVAMAVVAGKRGQGACWLRGMPSLPPLRVPHFPPFPLHLLLLRPFLSPSLSSRYFWFHTAFDLGAYAIALFMIP